MTSAPPPSSPSVPGPTRLNGWKEIAAHFDRGVRTVQRWEKTLGMPVYRIGAGRGENVHAFAHELDAWLAEAGRTRDLADQPGESDSPERTEPAAAPPSSPPPDAHEEPESSSPVAPKRRRNMILAAAGLVLLVALAAWVAWPEPQPSTAIPDGDVLRVRDADGKLLWSYQMKGHLPAGAAENVPGLGQVVLVADIDGDGSREVVAFVPAGPQKPVTELVCLEASGTFRWSRKLEGSIRFGDREFRSPWQGFRLFVTGAGPNTSLWAAWIHVESGEFPCLLERVSAVDGAAGPGYWSAGHVAFVKEDVVQGRQSVLVGAANNDHHGASLAVFDAGRVTGSAPAEDPDKVCRGCSMGGPREFLVFPPLDITTAVNGNGAVYDVRLSDAGELSVWVLAARVSNTPGWAVYHLDPSLRPTWASAGAEYEVVHQVLEREGKLHHRFGDAGCPQLWPVKAVEGGRWVPYTGASR